MQMLDGAHRFWEPQRLAESAATLPCRAKLVGMGDRSKRLPTPPQFRSRKAER